MKRHPSFVKLTQWEYWPTIVYYIPLLPLFLLRSLKAGHPLHFTAANPSILYSGSGSESKFKTLSLLPEELKPKSLLISKKESMTAVERSLKEAGITFPIIAKPDVGFRGYLVRKVCNRDELSIYLSKVNTAVILQEFIPHEKELGIFFHRLPGEKNGKITSVTIKRFMRIKGNGRSTISQLILEDERASLYYDIFKGIHGANLDKVLGKDQKFTLSVIGNHSKGTQFINGNHLINEELESFMNSVCEKIQGWNYGRMDIKFMDFNDMLEGKEFKILEINGIISEPTHIYDAQAKNASFWAALKSINRHWSIMSTISKKNHEFRGVEYAKVWPYLKNMLWLHKHSRKLKKLNRIEFN